MGVVLCARAARGARREAAREVGAHAERRMLAAEQVELVGEPQRRAGGAVAQPQQIDQVPDQRAHAARSAERPEVERAVILRIVHHEQPRRRLAGDPDEAVEALPLVLDVVRRAPAPDRPHLEQQRGELAGRVLPVYVVRVADDLGGLLAAGGAEVGEQPRTEPDRLADVQHAVARADHAVDAGPVAGVRTDMLPQQLGGWNVRQALLRAGCVATPRRGPARGLGLGLGLGDYRKSVRQRAGVSADSAGSNMRSGWSA